MIEFNNISKNYKERQLYSNFSFRVRQGEKVGLTGQSGSGKTTALNLAMGMEKPDSGEIHVFGEKLDRLSIRGIRKKIGWMPQGFTFFGNMKVIDVIIQPFTYSDNKLLTPDDRKITALRELFSLDKSIMVEPFNNISGGEKQRVGLMILLLLERPLLLLDEPTSALDSSTKSIVADILLGNQKQTILASTHDELFLNKCNNIIEIPHASN